MFCALLRPIYQVSVYRTIGPLVTIYGRGGQLGYVTSTSFKIIGLVVLEEKIF